MGDDDRLQLPPSLDGIRLDYVKTLQSAVTTAWGVHWDETYIARDIMQNFFDANRDRLADVSVNVNGGTVTITAPAPCNLERLFYLGSDKGADNVGHYGEGFKVAATCLLRDHSVDLTALSGPNALRLHIAKTPVGGTTLYPVEYDFFTSSTPLAGTLLILQGCSPILAEALRHGMNHFFHEGNPLLGERRWEDDTSAFRIYDSTDRKGHVFYRRLKRGEFDGIPVVLVIDKEYVALERKIRNDRDRNAFGDEVMQVFFNLFARHGLKYHNEAIRIILEQAQPCWVRGHPFLSEIAQTIPYPQWSPDMGQTIFAGRYFAKSTSSDKAEQLQFTEIERQWRTTGKIGLPQYFKWFGVLHAQQYFEDLQARVLREALLTQQRPPTDAEARAIQALLRAMRGLAPEMSAIFDRDKTSYTVAETEALLGELRTMRSFRSHDVFLAADVFLKDFAEAIATFLHEHAHIFGYDGHRGFTDALTQLIETIVRYRTSMDGYEEEWRRAKDGVIRERAMSCNSRVDAADEYWLAQKSVAELRGLLRQVPTAVLRKLKRAGTQG